MTLSTIGEIRGLPAHALLVHGVVVLVPLAAGLLVLAAWWPAARIRLGVFLPLLAAGCLAMIPLTTSAGQWLKQRVGNAPLIAAHAHLGRQLLPWTIGLLVLTLGVWWLGRRADGASSEPSGRQRAGRPATLGIVVAVLATLVAAGTVVQVVRIGESGSKAVWNGVIQASR